MPDAEELSYVVLSAVDHDGRRFEVGSEMILPWETAKGLLDAGAIDLPEAAPAAPAAPTEAEAEGAVPAAKARPARPQQAR